MNVTLNLMTEFEDIPRELSYMLKYVEEELSFASRRAANIATKMNSEVNDNQESMDLLHSVRLHMAKIDQRMEDCMSILAGYSHYLENPPEQEPVEDTPEEEINDKG
jgi:hypothetical protein